MKIKIYIGIIFFLFIITTLPLMNLTRYAHPAADDYGLAVDTRKEWIENHSVMGLLKAAHHMQKELYHTWEGKYISYYLWGLQPGIFGERYYKLTGLINIALLTFAIFTFFAVLVRYIFKTGIIYGLSLGSAALIMVLQWMPSPVEGLYWYCGAIGYNFFWSAVLLILSGIIAYSAKRKKSDIILIVMIILGGILLGGGNHITAFGGILLFFVIGLASVTNSNLKKYRISILAFIITTIGFLFNIMSPGTAIRSNLFPDKAGVAETIWLALQNGIMYIDEWITLPFILFVLLIVPIAITMCYKLIEQSDFEFRYPLLVFSFSIGYLCTLLCPSLYVMKRADAGRIQNTVYLTFIMLVVLNILYLTGYILKKIKKSTIASVWKEKVPANYLIVLAVIFAGIIIQPIKTSNGYLAMETVLTGDAAKYSDEAQNRYELALESEGKDLQLMDYTVKPELLFFDDIKVENSAGNNMMYADYYNLKSVSLKYWD